MRFTTPDPRKIAKFLAEDALADDKRAREKVVVYCVASDARGALWDVQRVSAAGWRRPTEPTFERYVQVYDVSKHDYAFLQVPTTCKTPHEAVAWGFGLKPEEYIPIVEC